MDYYVILNFFTFKNIVAIPPCRHFQVTVGGARNFKWATKQNGLLLELTLSKIKTRAGKTQGISPQALPEVEAPKNNLL